VRADGGTVLWAALEAVHMERISRYKGILDHSCVQEAERHQTKKTWAGGQFLFVEGGL
jgi:hypothetical protein